jgi:hypothetical protein
MTEEEERALSEYIQKTCAERMEKTFGAPQGAYTSLVKQTAALTFENVKKAVEAMRRDLGVPEHETLRIVFPMPPLMQHQRKVIWTTVGEVQKEFFAPTASSGAAGWCGLCGRRIHECSCLAELEVTPPDNGWSKPIPKPYTPAPLPPPPSYNDDRAYRAGAKCKKIERPVKGDACYLCARTNLPLVEIKSCGAHICESCAMQHLGD